MPEKITFYIISALFFMSVMSVFAQESDSEAEKAVELDQLNIMDEVFDLPIDYGDQLKIQVRQGADDFMMSDENQVFIEQHGDGNSTIWTQEGYNNTFELKQNGKDNTHEGSLSGASNYIKVLQIGNNNSVFQDLVGKEMNLEVIQQGSNHEVIQIEKDGASPSYKIHQQGGKGMKVIVEHERF